MIKTSSDIRWLQRLDNLEAAYEQLKQASFAYEKEPNNQLFQIALIKTFEMTFELSWKTLQDYLKFQGIDTKTPRETIKKGFHSNIIQDGQLWIDMLDNRNLMSYTYNKKLATQAVQQITNSYMAALQELFDYFKSLII